MSAVNNNLLLTADAGVAPSAYQISRSCRFNAPDTAYFSRTPSVAGNRKTWTWAAWVKQSVLSTGSQELFCGNVANFNASIEFNNNSLDIYQYQGGYLWRILTAAIFRDVSAWYHILVAFDSTQSTNTNRIRLYVNGAQITTFTTATYPSLNFDSAINNTVIHTLGTISGISGYYLNGYLADVHFIDGQALTPSSFTETNATTGQLVPKAYSGTYGTNGFRLNFSDNSAATAATLGADSRTDAALNGNNGTLVNGPTYSSANGGSIVFDGTNDYVDNTFSFSSRPFSINIWVYFNSVTGWQTFVGQDTSQATLLGLLYFQKTGTGGAPRPADTFSAGITTSSNAFIECTDTSTVVANTWYNFCCSISTTDIKLYRNGSLVQTTVNSDALATPTGTIKVGVGYYSNVLADYVNARIPQLSIYNKALSATEVTQNYNALVGRFGGTSTGSIVTDGMVLNLDAGNTASYPGTGTTWTDISLRKNNWTPNNLSVANSFLGGNNGTLVNGPTYSSTNGGSIVFDGSNDYARTTSLPLTGNETNLTLSCWYKPANTNTTRSILAIGDETAGRRRLLLQRNGQIEANGSFADFISSSSVLSANSWCNIVIVYTSLTVSSGIKLYFNGTEISGSGSFGATLNAFTNTACTVCGNNATVPTENAAGNIAQASIYNRALSASEVSQNYNALVGRFGGTSSGSIVTSGLVLNLDAGNTASYPGTGTTWTDISTRTNPGIDSLTDTPTSYGTDTGSGGEVRGNYATLNPLLTGGANVVLSNGNLNEQQLGGGYQTTSGTIYVSTGKWYAEMSIVAGGYGQFGIVRQGAFTPSTRFGLGTGQSGAYSYGSYEGGKYNNGSSTSYGPTFTTNDIIGCALDLDAGTVSFSKNGISLGTAFTALPAGLYTFAVGHQNTSCSVNFGQRPFAYAAPSGFKALCDTNLPTPTIAKGSSVFDTVLYTGTGAALTPTSSLAFSPDLVWIKGRSGATDHAWYDTVRGATLDLICNGNTAETTQTQGLTAFNSNGFSVGTLAKLNTSAATYAGWCWDAGSSTVTNTAGSITSQVRANASAGFSVVTYTGNGTAGASVGHGLGVAPSLVIVKIRSTTDIWAVHHNSFANTANNYLSLSSTAAVATVSAWFAKSSTVLTYTTSYLANNLNGATYVAYCFAPVTGYSAFGSYTGNGSADGSFVYLGFRPAFLLIKRTDATGNWVMLDAKRAGYNVDNDPLYANLSNVEATTDLLDITSNGFKLRSTNTDVNASGGTYVYACFAENPFQYSRAR
jgi:hypothetical protein